MKLLLITMKFAALLLGGILSLCITSWAYPSHLIEGIDITVTGKVMGNEGEPLIGASVFEIGTTNGTSTDSEGNYSILVTGENSVLRFSYIGYEDTDVTVGGQATINIQLIPSENLLDEVVVVGYGTQNRGGLTGAISSANLEAFQEAPNVNILQSLQGSVPGVQIGQINQAGQEPSLSIRGQTTLNGSTSPLIVVDGTIYRGNIGDLNPADIESVDVLKDPSSKAIYGAQAANGIVFITTKGGITVGKPTITYKGAVSRSNPTEDARLLNREEVLQKVRDVEYLNAFLEPDFTTPNPDWDFSQSELLPRLLEGIDNGTNFDWWDALTSPGYLMDHVLSISGGSPKTTYYLSGGYTEQEGFILNDDYDRVTIRLNIKTDINNWLTIGANTFGTFTDFSGNSPNMATLANTSPLVTPRDENGEFVINHLGDNVVNPFLNATADDRDNRDNLTGNFFGIVKFPFVQGLSYQLNFSNSRRTITRSYSNTFDAGQTGVASKYFERLNDLLLDNIITYERDFGDHNIKLTAVAGFNEINFDNTLARAENFANQALSFNSLEQGTIPLVNSAAYEEAFSYQTARINYGYKIRYFLTASIRRDGFSGFSNNNKTALFPSVGVGWVATEEPFFDIPAIDFLKVRGSYGENGNLTDRYSSLARVSAGDESRYVFGDGQSTSPGQSVASLANEDLTWETTTGINLGIDFEILNRRITGSVDYYRTTTNDLLWDLVLPRASGFSNIATNLGEIQNTGIEFAIQTTPISTDNFSWDLGVNFSSNQNEVVSLLGQDVDEDGREDDLIASRLFIGESIGTIFDYEIDGIWQVGDDVPDGYFPGTYKIVDQQPDEAYNITPNDDRRILGRTEPAYRFGIQNTLRYKDLTLRFFINSIQGGEDGYLGENHPRGVSGTTGTAQNSNWFTFYDYWSPSNPGGTFPQVWIPASIRPVQYFSRSFVRLQDVSLAYAMPSAIIERIGATGLKLYVSGKNLLTLTDWEGWDPETGQGVGNASRVVTDINGQEFRTVRAFPLMKTYTFGLELSF